MKGILLVLAVLLSSGMGIARAGVVDDSGFEVFAEAGKVVVNSYDDPTSTGGMFGFQWSVLSKVSPNFKLSLAYLNEGNPDGGVKRDGVAGIFKYRLPADMFGGRIQFSIGAGPYAYCSTEKPLGSDGSRYTIRHGLGAVVMPLEIRYNFSEKMASTISFYRVIGHTDINGNKTDTDVATLGINRKF
jgi:hypothetical protein